MTSDQRDVVFSLESPDLEEGAAGDGGESDTDENDDVAIPETNEEPEDDDPEEEDLTAVTVTVSASSTDAVTVALPAGSAVPVSVIPVDSSDPKWHRVTEIVHHQRPLPPPTPIDDSRRLFQRLWTDEDEIELLRGFLDYVATHRGGNSSHPPDTAPFYEMIKSKLQLEFNKNQLVEKLRRLKKKYRNVMSKISSGKEVFFKSPHDQSTFEISRKIWNQTGKIIGFEDNNAMDFEETNTNGNYFNSPGGLNPSNVEIDSENGVERRLMMSSSSGGSRKRSRSRIGKIEEDNKPIITPSEGQTPNAASNVNLNEPATAVVGGNIGVLIEETVKNCVSPVIKEMMNGTTSMMMAAMGGGGNGGNKAVSDERWRKQQILELEVYSRRLELVQEQIRATLHELKTMPSGV
ncbi:BnaAnng10740D [Brassica napus]|uniref:BnaAnng10740D protein n=1 Tax=Brassica napus TaxID=3708 RepID=A0A078ILF1_BRANA|nr:BnaAnng10740D [Brassica napus]